MPPHALDMPDVSVSTALSADSSADRRLSRRSLQIVLLFAATFLLPALGGSRVLTLHEVFAAQPAREMLSDGHWIIPHFAGEPRVVKPPATGWLIAGAMTLFQSRDEWVVRLPAALAGIATAGLMASWTARWLGDRAGLIAGLMQVSFAYVLMQARLAEADMPMCFAVVLAMGAFARGAVGGEEGRGQRAEDREETRGRFALKWVLLFHLGAGLAVLFKGTGIIFIFAGCLAWIVFARRWDALRFLFHPLGLIVLVVVAGAWPYAAWRERPQMLDIWYRETIGRSVEGTFKDDDPWHIYLWSTPMLLLPWLPFAIRGVIQWKLGHEGKWLSVLRRNEQALFLVCWFAVGFVLLTLSSARHKHYAIPILPAVTPVAAAGMISWLSASRLSRRAWLGPAIVVALGVAAAAGAWKFMPKGNVEAAITAGAIAVGIAVTFLFHATANARAVVPVLFLTTLAGGLLFQGAILPRFDDYKASADLGRRATQLTPAGATVHLVALGEAQIAWYVDRPLKRIDKRKDLAPFLRQNEGRDVYLLGPRSVLDDLRSLGGVSQIERVSHARRTEKDPVVFVRIRP